MHHLTHHLTVVKDGSVVEVIDEALDTWIVRFEPLDTLRASVGNQLPERDEPLGLEVAAGW